MWVSTCVAINQFSFIPADPDVCASSESSSEMTPTGFTADICGVIRVLTPKSRVLDKCRGVVVV